MLHQITIYEDLVMSKIALPANKKRNFTIAVRVTQAEFEQIDRDSHSTRRSLSEVMRTAYFELNADDKHANEPAVS